MHKSTAQGHTHMHIQGPGPHTCTSTAQGHTHTCTSTTQGHTHMHIHGPGPHTHAHPRPRATHMHIHGPVTRPAPHVAIAPFPEAATRALSSRPPESAVSRHRSTHHTPRTTHHPHHRTLRQQAPQRSCRQPGRPTRPPAAGNLKTHNTAASARNGRLPITGVGGGGWYPPAGWTTPWWLLCAGASPRCPAAAAHTAAWHSPPSTEARAASDRSPAQTRAPRP
jgi:hypothetical protein